MEELMRRDRAAFQDLVYEHFKSVADEARKNDERQAQLQRLIEEKDLRIQRLEQDFQDARRELSRANSLEEARRKRVLQPSTDRSWENKENHDPTPAFPLKTLSTDITPPSGSPNEIPWPQSGDSDAQTDKPPTNNAGMQTDYKYDPPSSPPYLIADRLYNELSSRYDQLEQDHIELLHKHENIQQEHNALKEAHDILIAKFRKDKTAWKAWVEHDQARREVTKKRKQEESNRRRTLSPIRKPYNTPSMTSSPPRPPALSPDSSPSKQAEIREPTLTGNSLLSDNQGFDPKPARKGGLFSGLQPSRLANFPKELDQMPDVNKQTPNLEAEPSSEVSSIPETVEQNRLPQNTGQFTSTSRTMTGDIPSDTTASDTGDEDNQITPKAKPYKTIPPPSTIRQKSVDVSKEGTSWTKPVVIKSEPQSSQNDPGYHLFDHASLDLDDVAVDQEREAPRKRRKLGEPVDGDVVIRQEEPEDDMFLDKLDDVNDLPMLPRGQLDNLTDADILPPQRPKPSEILKTPVRKTTNQTPQKSPQSTIRRGPITSTPAKRDHRRALFHVLEDGTDGEKVVHPVKEATDIRTNTLLDNLLSTPVPQNPTLRSLGKENVNACSVPPKKRDVLTTPTNSAAIGKRQAETDPLPTGKNKKNTADAHGVQTKKDGVGRFAINPANNDGLDYAYHEVVRNKEQRKCLPGCTRACCRNVGKFLEAAGLPPTEKRGPRWRSSSPMLESSQMQGDEQRFIQQYGRHREAFPRRRTPPKFWTSEMLDTQDLKEQHEEADRIEAAKEEMKRKESRKSGGRFVYKC